MLIDAAPESLRPRLRNRLRTGFGALIASIWIATPTFAADATPAAAPAAKKAAPAKVDPIAEKIENLKKKIQENPKNAVAVVQLAEQYSRQGRYDEATTLLWKQIDKIDNHGFSVLMQAHEAKKEWPEVIRAANLTIAKDPKNEEALTRLGNAQFMRNRKTEAKESLKKALEVNKMYQPAYDTLIRIYEGNNPYEQRLLLQDMVELFGPKAMFLTKLCTLNTNDGENEQGEKVCQQAIKVNPKIPENHVHLGIIAKQKDEPERAKPLLKAAAAEFPESEYAQTEAAVFMEAEKNYVDAYKYFDRCLTANPNSERCQMGLANSGIQLEKYDRAYEAFQKACRKNGRKNASDVRRAYRALQQRKAGEWVTKFETLAERCAYQ